MLRHTRKLCSVIIASGLFYGCSPENAPKTPTLQELSENQLRIAATDDPFTLDPRLVRDVSTANFMHLLYEGLFRAGPNGQIEPAIAKSYTVSDDGLTYLFDLRESKWANGEPLTAEDFVATWKSILSPEFPAPNAYQLFLIKGAKLAKEGKTPLDSIGIDAKNPTTLVVQLEEPASYFLELLSVHFFFPVHSQMRNQPNSTVAADKLIANGPFKIAHWKQRNELATIKNPNYWNAQAVNINGVTIQILDENSALQLFKAGKLDWAGSPMSTIPQDAVISLKEEGQLNIAPAAGTHWFRFNTQKPPFNNQKMRKAFALALDRQAIVEHITQGNQAPAIGVVPPSFGFDNQHYYRDHDTLSAQKSYMAALIDLKNADEKLPEITLCYASNERSHKIAQAVQQQWKKAFGVDVKLESCESKILFNKLHEGNYQISLASWYADIRDPINFLEIFKSKDNSTNNTFWEDQRFTDLLTRSSKENSAEERKKLLAQAEEILIDGMPVAPIFYGAFNYLKNNQVGGIYFSELGYLDFRDAFFTKDKNENSH